MKLGGISGIDQLPEVDLCRDMDQGVGGQSQGSETILDIRRCRLAINEKEGHPSFSLCYLNNAVLNQK